MTSQRRLDRLDVRILARLQKDSRITNVQLADAVGLSPSPCLARVKRLEKAGFIRGYGADIALDRVGSVQLAFTEVTLVAHRGEDFARFEACTRDTDEIVECHRISGGYDYLLKFVTRDVAHYQQAIESLQARFGGIDRYFSYLVIKSAIDKDHYPLENLVPC